MPINALKISYDEVCVYTSIKVKASPIAKFILAFINLFLLSVIVVFFIEGVILAALAFTAMELLMIKYTLWNILGEERLIINAKTISYQQHYGFFITPLHTRKFNKKVVVLPYDEVIDEIVTVKFLFESYDENNLPYVVYQSVLNITEADFEKLIKEIDRLFIDEMTSSYTMPGIHMN